MRRRQRRLAATGAAIGAVLTIVLASPPAFAAERLSVAVADSMCAILSEAGEPFAREQDAEISYICKSSGRLAKGLMGASIQADFYISANQTWMDRVVAANLVAKADVRNLWGNDLVVAAPRTSRLKLGRFVNLVLPRVRLVLIGDPGTAPFGRYAKQALQGEGIWDAVRPKIAVRKNITLLADDLSRADPNTVGILFSTNINDRLQVLVEVPEHLHEPIRYFSAPLADSATRPLVAAFVLFLESESVRRRLRSAGFKVLP